MSETFQVFRSFTRFTTKVFALLLVIAGLLFQITTPAKAETDAPINFLSLSVCSDKYLTRQIAICVPKGQNYVAQLSVKDINKGLTQKVLSDGKVIVPSTSKIISLSELPVALYEWQILSTSSSQTPTVIRDAKFKIIDLPLQPLTARSVKPTIDTTFVESYVLRYEDKSLESLLADDLGVPRENLKSDTLMSSKTRKQLVPSSSSYLIEIGLTKIQFNQLSNDKRVIGLEKNMIRFSSATQSSAPWSLDRLDQDSLPLNNLFTYEIGATTPVVYVLDTGLNQKHSEFSGRVADCWFWEYMTTTCADLHGHGTHVSGTALGKKYGAAKNAQLEFIKITYDNGSTSSFSIADTLRFVADNHEDLHPNQPGVLNLSFGCYEYCSTDSTAKYYFNQLVQKNIIPVVAAGNENDDACYYAYGDLGEYPYQYAIVVGATWINGTTDQRSFYSNYGSCVTIYAPGGAGNGNSANDIASAGITSNTAVAYMSGTSMASPLVAGVIANYLSINPTKTFAQVHDWLIAKARNNKIVDLPAGSVNKLVSIYSSETQQATLTIANTTLTGTVGTPITLSTSGGSGTGAVTFATTGTGCSISSASLSASAATTCVVTATKAASTGFLVASSASKSFTFSIPISVPLYWVVYPNSTFCLNQPYVVEVGFGQSRGEIVAGLNIQFLINKEIFNSTTNQEGKARYSYTPSGSVLKLSVVARYLGGPAVRAVQSTTRNSNLNKSSTCIVSP